MVYMLPYDSLDMAVIYCDIRPLRVDSRHRGLLLCEFRLVIIKALPPWATGAARVGMVPVFQL